MDRSVLIAFFLKLCFELQRKALFAVVVPVYTHDVIQICHRVALEIQSKLIAIT